jgi:hypothetical protein
MYCPNTAKRLHLKYNQCCNNVERKKQRPCTKRLKGMKMKGVYGIANKSMTFEKKDWIKSAQNINKCCENK